MYMHKSVRLKRLFVPITGGGGVGHYIHIHVMHLDR